MSTNNKPTKDQVTPEVIEQWKQQHGRVTKYTTSDGKEVYFRTPTRAEVSASAALTKEKDGLSANEFLASACSLGGDIEIVKEDKYLFGLGKHLEKIIEKVEGELTEL